MKIWHRGNPKLWYRDDLVNHPELIPLEGQEIDLTDSSLRDIYPGTILLTTPILRLSEGGFCNENCLLNVSSSTALCPPSALFGEELTVDNFSQITDQWWTNDTDLTTKQTITIEFTNTPYLPSEYWMIPAAGDSNHILQVRPTPKSWKLQGSYDGKKWFGLDHVENYTDWEVLQIRAFKIKTRYKKPFAKLRLIITEWNPGEEDDLCTGLRRFWVFGNTGKYVLPNIPSPDPAFVYVVPKNDLTFED